MGMTKEQKKQAALQTLGIDNTNQAKSAYRRQVLECHPDKLQYLEGATDFDKKKILTDAQARFIALTQAYDLLTGKIELTDDEDIGAEASAASAIPQETASFWKTPFEVGEDLPGVQETFNALFLIPRWTELTPHVYSIGYATASATANAAGVRATNISFSSQAQLAQFCNGGLKQSSGMLMFTALNFPRAWLGTVYDALATNKNLNQIDFPAGYKLDADEAKRWQALVQKPTSQDTATQLITTTFQNNRLPIIAGGTTAVALILFTGGLFFPLLAGLGVLFAGREIEKRMKQSREYYSEEKIKTLEGQPEAEAYHLGEEAAKGFMPLAHSLMDPKARQAPNAYVAGLQHALEPHQRRAHKPS